MANYNYFNNDPAVLTDYAQQYRDLGREVKVYADRIVVFDRPQRSSSSSLDKPAKERVRSRYRDADYGE